MYWLGPLVYSSVQVVRVNILALFCPAFWQILSFLREPWYLFQKRRKNCRYPESPSRQPLSGSGPRLSHCLLPVSRPCLKVQVPGPIASPVPKSSCPLESIPKRLKKLLKVKVKSLSHVRLFAIPWTVAYQALQSMESSWSGLPSSNPTVGHISRENHNSKIHAPQCSPQHCLQ